MSVPAADRLVEFQGERLATILLAEDDESMRRFLAQELERAGHDVTALGDGRNRLLLHRMAPTYFVNDVRVKHSRYPPAKIPDGYIPGWKLLDAVSNPKLESFARCFTRHGYFKIPDITSATPSATVSIVAAF